MSNMEAVNILSHLMTSGYMGRSTNEALQYAIDCIMYVVRVRGAQEYFDEHFGGEQ